ncbi:hypothetical protein ENH_00043560 [Eimeria necatrix]|uniref:Uncharacterized protein n=1 Tax=Eimeria necatrix TaxID=51315 RepID=U6MZC1_9EIME|nr:hypothetical protein ENH_00043560 [Eimeria necatrix]CDJ67864.1 hypothetical protein ENH_00043560 [Eimeria necatrix]
MLQVKELQLLKFVLPLLMLQLMQHHPPFPFASSAIPAGAASVRAGEEGAAHDAFPRRSLWSLG